jgi:hypothetical protein
MKKFEKIEVRQVVGKIDLGDLEGPIDSAIQMLERHKATADKNGWRDTRITVYWYYEDIDIEVIATRWETDAEFDARWEAEKARLDRQREGQRKKLEKAKKALEKSEAEERELLARLKSKYEA